MIQLIAKVQSAHFIVGLRASKLHYKVNMASMTKSSSTYTSHIERTAGELRDDVGLLSGVFMNLNEGIKVIILIYISGDSRVENYTS